MLIETRMPCTIRALRAKKPAGHYLVEIEMRATPESPVNRVTVCIHSEWWQQVVKATGIAYNAMAKHEEMI